MVWDHRVVGSNPTTPTNYDMKIDFYLKWLATGLLIIGCFFVSINVYPLGPIINLIGGGVWLIVSLMWKEWSLIVTNSVLLGVNALGLIYKFFII